MITGNLKIDELAAITGVSTRWIAKLQRDGIVPAPTKGEYPAEESLKRLFAYYRAKGEGDGAKIDTQRGRLLKSKADIADLQRKKAIGDVIERSKVIGSITTIIATVTARLLSIPSKIAQRLAQATKAADCEEIVRKAIEEALDSLSQLEVVYSSQSSGQRSRGRPRSAGNGEASASTDN